MKKSVHFLILILLFATGCPEIRMTNDKAKNWSKDLTAADDQGGQPGKVTVTGAGAVVMTDGQAGLDDRIQVDLTGGRGKNGNPATLEEGSKPQLVVSVDDPEALRNYKEEKTLITMGCDPALIQATKDKHNLEVIPVPEPVNDVLSLKANMVVFCGKVQLTVSEVRVECDKLTFRKAHLLQYGIAGGLFFMTNVLSLHDKSKIETRGYKVEVPPYSTPRISLTVIQSTEDKSGLLILKSTGTKYKKSNLNNN